MARSSFDGFIQPKRDGGKSSPYYPTQILDDSKFTVVSTAGSNYYTNYFLQVSEDCASDGTNFVYVLSGVTSANPNLVKVNKFTGASVASSRVGSINSTGGNCIAYDRKNGIIYIGLYNNGAIGGLRKYDSNLNELLTLTDVYDPSEIKVGGDGHVYVSYQSNIKTIRKLTSSFSEVWSNGDVPYLSGVDVGNSNSVYTCSSMGAGNKVVRKLTSSGIEVWSNTEIGNASAIAVDSNENVYVTYANTSGITFRKFSSNGTVIWSKNLAQTPREVHVDMYDNIYVGFQNSVSPIRFDTNGNQIFASYDAYACAGIDSDADSLFLSIRNNMASLSRRSLSTKIQLK